VPYGPAEFPEWQKNVRRAEILSFGALPFVTFFSSLYYNVYRYFDHDKQKEYLPWPLNTGKVSEPLSEDEQKKIFMYSAGISVGVAAFDFVWRTLRHEMKVRKEEREYVEPIVITPIVSELDTSELDTSVPDASGAGAD
jgi:hypothetical protein